MKSMKIKRRVGEAAEPTTSPPRSSNYRGRHQAQALHRHQGVGGHHRQNPCGRHGDQPPSSSFAACSWLAVERHKCLLHSHASSGSNVAALLFSARQQLVASSLENLLKTQVAIYPSMCQMFQRSGPNNEIMQNVE